MAFENDLRALLLADSTIGGLVGTRVFQDVIPEGSMFPCLVFKAIVGNSEESHAGSSNLEHPHIQFDAYATTSADRWTITRALLAIFQPAAFRQTVGATKFDAAICMNSGAGSFEADTRLYRAMSEFEIWYHV